jgi:uncharacterized protein with GYD domain
VTQVALAPEHRGTALALTTDRDLSCARSGHEPDAHRDRSSKGWDRIVAIFLVQAKYEAAARAALVKSPEDREEKFRGLVEKAGGKLLSFFFALGDADVIATYEAPDQATALAISMAVSSARHLESYRTTPIMSMKEALAAMKKAATLSYEAPRGLEKPDVRAA